MRKIYSIFLAVLLSASVFAQSPQKMSYQAVIRNSSDQLVTNHAVGMRVSILQGSSTGTAVYVETQTPSTNANGLVSIEIGSGTIVTGTFAAIDWSAGTYFIKTETDPTGGTSYNITGTSQLLSVPYALYAKTVASYPETDPVFAGWDRSTGITIPSSQVIDFQTSVTNNAAMLLNTAKNSYPTADATKVANLSGTNTGDNAVNTLYSGLITNATHTGDVTGSGVLTLATVNSNVGTFNNITINAKGLATAGSNVSYLTSETDPTVKAITGIVKSNGTTISAATAGTDYLTPTGSAALLINFPILNQNTTGSAASLTGSLAGDVTGTQGATVVGNATVIGKVLTGYVSGAGKVTATDNILQAIQKLNGNNPMHYIGESYGGGIVFYVYDNGQHGLIAATVDATVNGTSMLRWIYNASTARTAGAGGNGIGAGKTNTSAMLAMQFTLTPTAPSLSTFSAAVGASDYFAIDAQGVRYGDWYLPSANEMILATQSGVVPNLASYYWSSTEASDNSNYAFAIYGGSITVQGKDGSFNVRAIRAF
jgi:hypothetical protein